MNAFTFVSLSSIQRQIILNNFFEKALPPYEGEIRDWKDGSYKFENGRWGKIRIKEEPQKLPSKINKVGNLEFDYINQTIKHGEDEYSLTPTENSLLKTLTNNKDKFLSRQEIMKEVWGNDNYETLGKMDVYLGRLRKILKLDPSIQLTNTYGMGFKLIVTPGIIKEDRKPEEIKAPITKSGFFKRLQISISDFKSVGFDGEQLLVDSKRDKNKIVENLRKNGLDGFFSEFKLDEIEKIWISTVLKHKFSDLS